MYNHVHYINQVKQVIMTANNPGKTFTIDLNGSAKITQAGGRSCLPLITRPTSIWEPLVFTSCLR